ncbi:site-specific integrase [Aliarcobacter butzleri]|nr:site-specific integrase [Aliarcobacter butzleri]
MNIFNTNFCIKSVRLYVENELIKVDYRTTLNTKLPKGKSNNRFRFSTGLKSTKENSVLVEKKRFQLAEEHYQSLFDIPEYKEKILFSDIAFLALKESEVDRKKEDATIDYNNILKKDVIPYFGKFNIKDIKVKDIKSWMIDMSKNCISQSRFNKKYYVVKKILDYALENEYIESNPISFVKRSSKLFSKAKDKSNDYFSKDEIFKILNDRCENGTKKDKKDHLFINTFMHIALYTGARTGEIMALKISDIDFNNSTITFQRSIRRNIISTTKTGKSRTIPIVNDLKDVLLTWIKSLNSEYLFTRPYKNIPYSNSKSIVERYYKPMLKRLNIPYLVIYNTRHTFASIAIESKIPLSTVSRCLGHSTLSTTERFYLQFGNMDQNEIRTQLENLIA